MQRMTVFRRDNAAALLIWKEKEMVPMMNDVIDKLAEIEAAAVRIAESTSEQKAKIAQDSEKREADYDREIRASVDRQIQEMKSENDRKIELEIAQMREENEKELVQLEKEYEQRHEKLVAGIVERLTGV